MQCIVRQGDDYVYAVHEDGQAVATDYPAVTVTGPTGEQTTIPAGDVVVTPHNFRFAYDDLGRRKDPRRFAAEGGTPLGIG